MAGSPSISVLLTIQGPNTWNLWKGWQSGLSIPWGLELSWLRARHCVALWNTNDRWWNKQRRPLYQGVAFFRIKWTFVPLQALWWCFYKTMCATESETGWRLEKPTKMVYGSMLACETSSRMFFEENGLFGNGSAGISMTQGMYSPRERYMAWKTMLNCVKFRPALDGIVLETP